MILNRAKRDPIWRQMRSELVPILGPTVKLVFPETWSEKYLTWYREIEQSSFRQSLTYSEEEILERLAEYNVLMMFLTVDGIPSGLVLGYTLHEVSTEVFYLDTIAVKLRGRGIGRIILMNLIRWTKKMGYQKIQLDTEFENEAGFHLSSFYEHMGFRVVDSDDETGNITMQLLL